MKQFLLAILLLCGNSKLSAQLYPDWLLHERSLHCSSYAVGYSEHSFFKDSSAISQAIERGAIALAIQHQVTIVSLKKFWTTAIGSAMMQNDFKVSYDTALAASIKNQLTVLDTFVSGSIVAVLVSPSRCAEFDKQKTVLLPMPSEKELWVTEIPTDEQYYYAVGSAPEYYYKTSSIQEAEKSALYALAATKANTISSLQKKEDIVEEKRKEEISVTLSGFEVCERWKDRTEKIFYVLARIPKQ